MRNNVDLAKISRKWVQKAAIRTFELSSSIVAVFCFTGSGLCPRSSLVRLLAHGIYSAQADLPTPMRTLFLFAGAHRHKQTIGTLMVNSLKSFGHPPFISRTIKLVSMQPARSSCSSALSNTAYGPQNRQPHPRHLHSPNCSHTNACTSGYIF